ncbi:hypothetical protein [Streptomyces werraensis]|uniref:hypothetical protein n=1 Tax=Streptomyces werraensis TaxID=68284 RepID=UPI0034159904
MSYDRTVRLAGTDFDAATAAVRRALADQGFGDHTLVQALDPGTMVTLTGLDALKPVADEATARLDAALSALSAP